MQPVPKILTRLLRYLEYGKSLPPVQPRAFVELYLTRGGVLLSRRAAAAAALPTVDGAPAVAPITVSGANYFDITGFNAFDNFAAESSTPGTEPAVPAISVSGSSNITLNGD